MDQSDQLAALLQSALQRTGLSQTEVAARVGVRQPTVSDWVHGKKRPGPRNLKQLLTVLGLDENVLEAPASAAPVVVTPEQDVVYLPHMAYVSAGEGFENGDIREVDVVAYSRRELRRMTNVSPDRLRTVTVVGNSMEPEIRANDTVGYLPTETLADDGLYVFSLDGATKVKLLQRFTGGAIQIIPLNPVYEREMLMPVQEADTPNLFRSKQTGLVGQLHVIGKVMFYFRPA